MSSTWQSGTGRGAVGNWLLLPSNRNGSNQERAIPAGQISKENDSPSRLDSIHTSYGRLKRGLLHYVQYLIAIECLQCHGLENGVLSLCLRINTCNVCCNPQCNPFATFSHSQSPSIALRILSPCARHATLLSSLASLPRAFTGLPTPRLNSNVRQACEQLH
jgi:hypothetical protein